MSFSSGRVFKVWDYNVSHRQLLLRSPRAPDIETNVDVVFWGVEFVELPTVLKSVEIGAWAREEPGVGEARLDHNLKVGNAFCVSSAGERYVVVAKGFKVLENTLDIFDSSLTYFGTDRSPQDLGVVLAHS